MRFYSLSNFTLITLSFYLCSCAVGPDYVRPAVAVPAKFKEAKGKNVIVSKQSQSWKVAEPRDTVDRGEWWKIFHDPTLNHLEAQLNTSNESVINSYYNYVQALAVVDEARAGFFPTLSGDVNITRQKQGAGTTSFISSSNTGVNGTGVAVTGGSASNISLFHTWALQAAWEPDIWGQVRRTVEANKAGADASADLFAATRLSSQASLAQYYFQVRGLDKIQRILNETVLGYKKALKITQDQYRAGIVSRSDVVQAQSTLETT